MQFACINEDCWQLRDAELAHPGLPLTGEIPSLSTRTSLKPGDAVRIILEIALEDEKGEQRVEWERGFVIVAEVVDDKYIGILDFQPACLKPDQDDTYLCFGAEIPFAAQHVIDIDHPPEDYVEWQLEQPPERIWYRR
ncbi:MAG: hypothetical protein CMI09_02410 [Oceanospirillaceae bacterium]|nr:hypothetical protein [Oceanospirillaceae bacterium]